MDDPEGNLVIVERVGHESQRHFPYWEHSWAGTAHVLNSTRHGRYSTLHRPRTEQRSTRHGTAQQNPVEVRDGMGEAKRPMSDGKTPHDEMKTPHDQTPWAA
jgi:hypothetical protein